MFRHGLPPSGPFSPGRGSTGRAAVPEFCASCHTLFLKGADWPDLTPYQRDDLGPCSSIPNPSARFREGFENVVIETRDGWVLNGFLADQGCPGGDAGWIGWRRRWPVRRSEIVSRESAGRSLMPDGLLEVDGSADSRLLRIPWQSQPHHAVKGPQTMVRRHPAR